MAVSRRWRTFGTSCTWTRRGGLHFFVPGMGRSSGDLSSRLHRAWTQQRDPTVDVFCQSHDIDGEASVPFAERVLWWTGQHVNSAGDRCLYRQARVQVGSPAHQVRLTNGTSHCWQTNSRFHPTTRPCAFLWFQHQSVWCRTLFAFQGSKSQTVQCPRSRNPELYQTGTVKGTINFSTGGESSTPWGSLGSSAKQVSFTATNSQMGYDILCGQPHTVPCLAGVQWGGPSGTTTNVNFIGQLVVGKTGTSQQITASRYVPLSGPSQAVRYDFVYDYAPKATYDPATELISISTGGTVSQTDHRQCRDIRQSTVSERHIRHLPECGQDKASILQGNPSRWMARWPALDGASVVGRKHDHRRNY